MPSSAVGTMTKKTKPVPAFLGLTINGKPGKCSDGKDTGFTATIM